MLRSCYAAQVQFDPKRPDVLVGVQWYFVPADRPALPFPSAFGSRIYDREEYPEPDLGERYSPVPWRGGLAPRQVSDCGLCGDEEAWFSGVTYPWPPRPTYPGTLIPTCCCPPIETAIGAEIFSGSAGYSVCCDDFLPETLYAQFTVVSGACPDFNGLLIPLVNDGSHPYRLFRSPVFSIGGVPCTILLGCNHILGAWNYTGFCVQIGVAFYFSFGPFIEPACSPFVLEALNVPATVTGACPSFSLDIQITT